MPRSNVFSTIYNCGKWEYLLIGMNIFTGDGCGERAKSGLPWLPIHHFIKEDTMSKEFVAVLISILMYINTSGFSGLGLNYLALASNSGQPPAQTQNPGTEITEETKTPAGEEADHPNPVETGDQGDTNTETGDQRDTDTETGDAQPADSQSGEEPNEGVAGQKADGQDSTGTDNPVPPAPDNGQGKDKPQPTQPKEPEELVVYNTYIPAGITKNLKYTKYPIELDYVIAMYENTNIRQRPDFSAPSMRTAKYLEKLKVVAQVKGSYSSNSKTDRWYKVTWKQGNQTMYGYVISSIASLRTFQFDKMQQSVQTLTQSLAQGTPGYISNYKDSNGPAPLWKGKSTDYFGERKYQAAPAYFKPDPKGDFRYITDGTLIRIMAETPTLYKVWVPKFGGEFFVPKKYVNATPGMKELKKVIVVDRRNQNEGVFEIVNQKLQLVSYTYATTGAQAAKKLPTDLGYYMAIARVSKFQYLSDTSNKIAGYAPYAIRFNGGAYIHGVPVDYVKKNGKTVDPGMIEYSHTLGTIPLSHKCVRNYTSHAKFLYDWVEIGKTAVIVIE